MKEIIFFFAAAFFEIAGCFSFWLYFRLHKSWFWLFVGVLALVVFAYLLTKVQVDFAGRAYAIYGGIYIMSSLLWLFFVENIVPDRWDIVGASLCIAGALIILFMPR